MRRYLFGAAVFVLLACVSVFAQETTGTITGRVVDQQGAAIPGATVTAKSATTGFTRTETSDSEGVYRLAALPVGIYEVNAELSGFSTVSKKDIEVNVAQVVAVEFAMKVAQLGETVNVTGATPLIQTTASSVGAVVDVKRIESIPLNGRQFANLAATVPGVGLSFHSDPTKSTQYAPLVNGGAGRNINYQIDGGDNNDDTVGGLLQQFPLEPVQEFNFQTQRFKAEYGRSFGGPIERDKAHFFVAFERTQQDKSQAVNTQGLFPDRDGIFAVPNRENLFTGKVTTNMSASQYLSVRYARNNNSAPYNAAP